MRELSMKKFLFIVGTLVLLLAAFFAGGIALASVSAASGTTLNKGAGRATCDKKDSQCKGGQDNSPNSTKAIVTITSVSGNRIQGTILQAADNIGRTITIITTSSTNYQPDQSAVAVGKTIFVVGTVNSDGSITAQFLGTYDPTEADFGGVITSINHATLTIEAKGSLHTIVLTAQTTYASLQAGTKETQPASLSELKVGETIEVSGKLNSDGSLTAASVMIIPAGGESK